MGQRRVEVRGSEMRGDEKKEGERRVEDWANVDDWRGG